MTGRISVRSPTPGPTATEPAPTGRPVGVADPFDALAGLPWRLAGRLGAAMAAAALAVSSSGSLVVLGVALALALGSRPGGVAAVLGTGAVAVRFGTFTLDDLAGLQTVLGPGATIGTTREAAAVIAGAAAIALAGASAIATGDEAAPTPWPVPAAVRGAVILAVNGVAGVVAATVAWGPDATDLVVRATASVAGGMVVIGIGALVRRAGRGRAVAQLAVAVGAIAVVLAGAT